MLRRKKRLYRTSWIEHTSEPDVTGKLDCSQNSGCCSFRSKIRAFSARTYSLKIFVTYPGLMESWDIVKKLYVTQTIVLQSET